MLCGATWCLTLSEMAIDGSIDKFKARLVADGNSQRFGVDFDRVFSTVAKLSTLRIVFVIAASRDLNLTSIDIRQAYLQATLSEELYMQVPPGMPDTDKDGDRLVARLKRSLYGLKQAGRSTCCSLRLSRLGGLNSLRSTYAYSLTLEVNPY